MDNWYSWVFLTILNGMGTAVMRASPDSSGEVEVFQHIVFEDFKIDISLPQTIECDASDFTVLFTFVGLVPAVFWTSGGKFHYMVVWQQFVLQVSQIISQWWLGHSLGGMEHD